MTSANRNPQGGKGGNPVPPARATEGAASRVRGFLAPPVFDDERQSAEAAKMWAVLIGLIATVTVFFPITALLLPQHATRYLTVAALNDLFFLGLLVLVHRRLDGLAAFLLVTALIGAATYSSFVSGGVRAPAMMAFPLFVAIAGILRGAVAAVLTGLASITVGLSLLVAEQTGHLPPPTVQHTAGSTCAVLIFLLVVIMIVHAIEGAQVRRAERARQDSDRRYRQLFEQAQVGIYLTTPDGKILEANPALLNMLGYSSIEELAKNNLEGHGSYAPEYSRQQFREMLDNGEVRGLEAEWRRADGQIVFVRENAQAIRGKDGKIICYEGTVEDFTERKKLETQRRQSSKMEAIGHLAGGVAHDFNNILAGLLLNIGLTQQEPDLSEVVVTSLKEMENETKRAAALTRRLLLFSRQQVMEPKVLDLNYLLEELAKMLRRIVGENYQLVIDREDRAIGVNADASMIDQAIMNLCVNARDAMAKGGSIVVTTREVLLAEADVAHRPEAKTGRFARLDVVDTGCGMSEETKKRLFEPFFTTKKVGEGTGLGLATAYSVIQQHGGWIEVESREGEGSRFSIFLPVAEGAVIPVSATPSAPVRLGREGVLLLEDEPAVRKATRRFLERFGYRVIEAASGPEAIRIWGEDPSAVDLLLTDMVLPGGMSGLDVAETLKARRASLRIILCSGYNVELLAERGHKAIGATFLMKPFTAADLSAAIRKCTESNG
jgi:PAS domain S-box-containing protein